MRFRVLIFCFLLMAASCASQANFLDDYINNIKLDQTTAPRPGNDGPHQVLADGRAFGQTFITGPEVVEIYQIAIESPHWNDQWGEGTSLVMALYDGPEKANKLSEFEMKYEWRSWEDMKIVFPMKAAVEPGKSYYFELTARGGNGTIGSIMTAPEDYPNGRAYIDGKPQDFDFIFQTYVHTTWDRDAAYAQMFAKLNLDYPPLAKVKAAVQAKDWETAAKEMVVHFESRPQLVPPPEVRKVKKIDPNFDRTAADLAADMKVGDADGNIISLGPNWNHLRWWPTRGGIGLTRSGIRKYLAHAYSQTGEEKFAIAWNDMLKAVLVDLPSPIKAGVLPEDAKETPPILPGGIAGGSMWAGLSTGARMGHGFAYYAAFVDSPNFTWDVRAAFIFNLADMADVLAAQKGGGNWATQMTDSLFEFGTHYPEFARSKEFFEVGYDGLLANMRETLTPDGPIGESAGYQGMVHGRYVQVPGDARRLGLDFPEDLHKQIEDAVEFHLYTITPDGHMPAFGDANPDATSDDILLRGAEEFGRQDMLWVATAGKQGVEPARTSVEYPYSNYYVMRSDWSPDALFMVLKNGRYTSHGHRDSLGFVMYALGNPIFVDPGTYIYGTPEAIRHNATRSHSTIGVDGANLDNAGGPNKFFTGVSADLLIAHGPKYEGLSDSIRAVRRVAFLKPDYWVFSDVVNGEGEHTVESRFHYANKNAALDEKTQIARTTYSKGGNVAVIPVRTDGITSVLEDADVAGSREQLIPAYILKQSATKTLPIRLDNVMYPFRGGSPDARVTELQPGAGAGVDTTALQIATSQGTDYVVFSDGKPASFSGAKLSAAVQCAVVREDKKGKVRSFAWMWGNSLSKGSNLATCARPFAGLDVVYAGDTVLITTRGEDPTLLVATLGASKALVNGVPVPVHPGSAYVAPFSGRSSVEVLMDDELAGFAVESPLVGGSVGGDDQVGYGYHWCHVSPGRPSRVSYTPMLPSPGMYEVSVFVPSTRLNAGVTTEARYILQFEPGGRWGRTVDARVKSMDTSRAASGEVELVVDQAAAAGSWVSLGVYQMKSGSGKLDLLADAQNRGPAMLADAVKWRLIR